VVGCLGAKVAGYPSTKGFLAPFVAYIRTCLQSHPRKNSPPWLLLLSGLPINKGIPCSLCCFYKNMSPISTRKNSPPWLLLSSSLILTLSSRYCRHYLITFQQSPPSSAYFFHFFLLTSRQF
jgi:hypothetical protein